jgi:hypothetical protein
MMVTADISFVEAGAIVVVAVLAVATVAGLRFIYTVKTKEPLSAPDGWGTAPDDLKWETEATELAHTELASVRESAKNWAASIGALLTVGGTVGLIKGEEAFSKLGHSAGNFAFWLTLAAAVLAGLAIAFATFAAQGTPARYKGLDGWTLQNVSRNRTLAAMRQLMWSRILATIGAVAVLAALTIGWKAGIAEEHPSSGQNGFVTTVDGKMRCGALATSGQGRVSVAVGKTTMAVSGKSDIDIVEKCPPVP